MEREQKIIGKIKLLIIIVIAGLIAYGIWTRPGRYQMYVDSTNNKSYILDIVAGRNWCYYNVVIEDGKYNDAATVNDLNRKIGPLKKQEQ